MKRLIIVYDTKRLNCCEITKIHPITQVNKYENGTSCTDSFKHFDLYFPTAVEIGHGIFTGWFHLNPLPLFSRHPSKESSLRRVSSRKCVCPCVRRPHSTNSSSRSLAEEKKMPLYPRTLTKSVVVDCNKKGKSGYGVGGGSETERTKRGSRGVGRGCRARNAIERD